MKMKMMRMMMAVTMVCLIASAVSAPAAIVYVDAAGGSGGNTVNASNNSVDDWYQGTSKNDTLWAERTGLATGGTIYEALMETNNGSPENLPKLKTTLTGLNSGETYNVWVFFVDNTGDAAAPIQNWSLGADLNTTVDTTYWSEVQPLAAHNSATPVVGPNGSGTVTSAGVVEASTLDFVLDPVFTENAGLTSERRLYGVNIGTASGSTTADVYIQQLIETNSGSSRTWYDGVGYEVIPEPATLGMLGIAGLAIIWFRKRFVL